MAFLWRFLVLSPFHRPFFSNRPVVRFNGTVLDAVQLVKKTFNATQLRQE